jgi:hypothetical protein
LLLENQERPDKLSFCCVWILMLLVMSFLCAWILLQFVLSVIFCLLQHKGLTTYLYIIIIIIIIIIIMLQLWVV